MTVSDSSSPPSAVRDQAAVPKVPKATAAKVPKPKAPSPKARAKGTRKAPARAKRSAHDASIRSCRLEAVAAAVPKVLAPLLAGRPPAEAALLLHWHEIAGPSLAELASPRRLSRSVPRTRAAALLQRQAAGAGKGANGGEPEPKAAHPRRRPVPEAAVLTLSVEPGFATEVQHRAHELIERINTFFGYRCVARLRLVQDIPLRGRVD